MSETGSALFRIERKQTLEQRRAEKKKLTQTQELRAPELVIGTRSNADLPLDDPVAAERHCAIAFRGGRFVLRNLENASGTYLNGVPVTGEQPISSGDRIAIGVTVLELFPEDGGTLGVHVYEGGFFFAMKKRGEFESDADEWVRSEVTFGRMPLLWALNAAAILLALAGGWWLWAQPSGQAALQPGALSSAHAALFSATPPSSPHLASAVAIAQEQGCAACHTSFDRPSTEKCAQCHGELVEAASNTQAHPFGDGDALSCVQCHQEHHGSRPPAGTLHPQDISAQCSDCHGDEFQDTPSLLQGIALAVERFDLAPTTAQPVARVASQGFEAFDHGSHAAITDCAQCHAPAPEGSDMDFGRVEFEGCMECHAAGSSVAADLLPPDNLRWTTTWHGVGPEESNCRGCHAEPYAAPLKSLERLAPQGLAFTLGVRSHTDEFHSEAVSADCSSCHLSGDVLWAGRQLEDRPFRHEQHLSALRPDDSMAALVEGQCRECHQGRATSTGLTAAPAHYLGPDVKACATCHQEAGEPQITSPGAPLAFPSDQLATATQAPDFPHAQHMDVEGGCFACHSFDPQDPSRLRTPDEVRSCTSCHIEREADLAIAHASIGGGECSACHQPRGAANPGAPMASVFYGAPSLADTAPSSFPHFLEAHQGPSCTECHGTPSPGTDIHSPPESAASCRECHAASRFHWR